MHSRHDVVIVGGGAAGLSAGIVLARAQAKVLLVDAGEPRNAPAEGIHGFVSRDGTPPLEFQRTGREEFVRYGGSVMDGHVDGASRRADGRFELRLTGGSVAEARAVLVATGLSDELPGVPGLSEFWGSAVHHCPHCHGFEVRGQRIVVLGGQVPRTTLHQAALLRRYSERVTLCPNGMDVPEAERRRLAAFGVRTVDGPVRGLISGATGELAGIEFADRSQLPCETVFIAPRARPNDALLRDLGCDTDPDTGGVRVDATGQASVPGVWAAGNVVNPRAQVITAAGEASATAIALTGWLLERDLDAANNGTAQR